MASAPIPTFGKSHVVWKASSNCSSHGEKLALERSLESKKMSKEMSKEMSALDVKSSLAV